MQWRKLAILILVSLILVGVSATWSAWRRAHSPAAPVLIPGTVSQQAPR